MDFRVREIDVHALKRPLFARGIHLDSHAGTCADRGQEQLGGVRACIISSPLARFVRPDEVRANRYVLEISHSSGIYGYISAHSTTRYLFHRAVSVAKPPMAVLA